MTAPIKNPSNKHLTTGIPLQGGFIGEALTKSDYIKVLDNEEITKIPNIPLYEGDIQGAVGIQKKTLPITFLPNSTKFESPDAMKSAKLMMQQYEENKSAYDSNLLEGMCFKDVNYLLQQDDNIIKKENLIQEKKIIDLVDTTNEQGPVKDTIEGVQKFNVSLEKTTKKIELLNDGHVYDYINNFLGKNPIVSIEWCVDKVIVKYYNYEDCKGLIEFDDI